MLVSRKKRGISPPIFLLNGSPLEQVFSYKYLGVYLASDMRWRTHIDHICTVARKLIGLLYRQFYNIVDSTSLLELYRSMIRPHLEYAAAVWDPHLARDKDQLEKVQKFALRMCCKSWEDGYHMLLEDCGLEARRQYLKLCTLFKIIHGEQFYQPGVFVQKDHHSCH